MITKHVSGQIRWLSIKLHMNYHNFNVLLINKTSNFLVSTRQAIS